MTTSLGHRHSPNFTPPPRRRPHLPWRRGVLMAPTLALMAALLVAGPALSALRIGTAGNDTLVGTNSADQFTGRAGNDLMRGLAGNDIYYFDDGFGNDTIEELATYKVGGKKKPGGVDTLSFAKFNNGPTFIWLISQWQQLFYNRVVCGNGCGVTLGASVIENVTAGSYPGESDQIYAGAEKNTLQPGGGTQDVMYDYGGFKPVGSDSRVALPASDDTYKGFAGHGGTVWITDFGGAGDVLDLRPFAAGDVYIDAVNADPTTPPPGGSGGNTTEESLQIVTGGTNQVIVHGHFSPFFRWSPNNQQGQIETLLFTDGTFSASAVAAAATGASVSTAALGGGAELEQAAKRLLAEALRAQDLKDDRSNQRDDGGEGRDVKTADAGTQQDQAAKDKKDQKHDKQAKKREQKDKSDKPDKRQEPQRRTERLGQRDLDPRGRAWGQGQGGSR